MSIQAAKGGLTFGELREANMLRLPQFKNKHGETAHSKNDGSDWSPAKWLRAVVGELGELAQVRIWYEEGKINRDEYERNVAKELADVQTYLDLFAMRLLDITQEFPLDYSSAQTFMQLVCDVGTYANEAKKYDRGDITVNDIRDHTNDLVHTLTHTLRELRVSATTKNHPADVVINAHMFGVDLGRATVDKFNEVSRRVQASVFIDCEDGVLVAKDELDRQRLAKETDPSNVIHNYD